MPLNNSIVAGKRKPIKVLHVLDVEKEAHFFTNLADFTERTEVEHSFVTFASTGPFTRSMEKRNFRVYTLDVHTLDVYSKSRLPAAAMKLWKILRAENPDIVHTHLFNPTVMGLFLSKLSGRKTVITRHHSDAIHLLAGKSKRRFYQTLERFNNRTADFIIAPSRAVQEIVVDWEGAAMQKVSVIPYGQNTERFETMTPELIANKRAELGMDKQLSLVCVSRLYHRKGHSYLFEALAPMFKNGLNARLFLVGAGEHQAELERYAAHLGIRDKIEFLGWRDDTLAIIGAADIIVHPSLEDALSQALIESVMMARPIVATDISGATDILDGGKYGKLVVSADADKFRAALEETISDLDQAGENARKGRDFVLGYMDANRVSAEYSKIYKKLLNHD